MAFQHFDRISEKYGWDKTHQPSIKMTGPKYESLVSKIIAENCATIDRRILDLDKEHWQKSLSKYKPDEAKTFILPNVSDVLPQRSVYIIKAAQSGKQISDTLRQNLAKKLRFVLDEQVEPHYIQRRGAGAGKISPKTIANFEKGIRDVFETYTKRDPKLGMPKNIHTIAVTEVRTTVNAIKDSYVQKIYDKNPGWNIRVTWIQNKGLSKEPRRGHSVVNGSTINFGELFEVPEFKKIGKRWFVVGIDKMKGPHDPSAPAGQKISCNCDAKYSITKKK